MTSPRVAGVAVAIALVACATPDAGSGLLAQRRAYVGTDTMGVVPASPVAITLQAPAELTENSAATLSRTQSGVFFTINDSGHEPLLFAFDSSGAGRGVWRITGASNQDWEAASTGPCSVGGSDAARFAQACVYIGEVGDNGAKRPTRAIYRVREPAAETAGFRGELAPAKLVYRYPDRSHDVEAMYVAPNGDLYLITKRQLRDAFRQRRPALVFKLPSSAWSETAPVTATLVDSLPIVPGSAPLRQITDAALSPDARYVAVRTYAQVYVFAADSVTGRMDASARPSVCNVIAFDRWQGEGVAWYGRTGKLLLTAEGHGSPMHVIDCPMPSRRQ
jgi:hypothetical protein